MGFIFRIPSNAGQYWISTLGTYVSDIGYGIDVDSSGNVYTTGHTGNGLLSVTKQTPAGAIEWSIELDDMYTEIGRSVAVDSSGNVYVAGTTTSAGAGNNDIIVVKYNTSGTLQWQRALGGTGSDVGYGIAVDSSGNVYVAGDRVYAKYNTSGTLLFQKNLPANDVAGAGIAIQGDYAYVIASNTPVTVYKFLADGTGLRNQSYTPTTISLTGTTTALTQTTTSLTQTTTELTTTETSLESVITPIYEGLRFTKIPV